MFSLAILIGVYSYGIFCLGLAGILHKPIILIFTLLYIGIAPVLFMLAEKKSFKSLRLPQFNSLLPRGIIASVAVVLFIAQIIVNLIGALAPELAFDALWYHLTLPKLYLSQHAITFVSGNLFYYSVMPKLADLVYVGALAVQGEILAKLIHLILGICTAYVIYQFGKQHFSKNVGILAAVIFYGNIVVAWESTTAYIDLFVAFFTVLSLFAFFNYRKTQNKKWLTESAILTGLAITTKLLAIGNLILFAALLFYSVKQQKIKDILVYQYSSILIFLPWLVFSYVSTGNPIYPFFSGYSYGVAENINSLQNFVLHYKELFFHEFDPISPIYAICILLIIFTYKKMQVNERLLLFVAVFGLVFWGITYQQGAGGRYILPYLPIFSLLTASILVKFSQHKKLFAFLVGIVFFVSSITIGYRFVAQIRFMPVVFGQESKSSFLSNNLNYSFGDFYDTDGYFAKTIKPNEKVLLYGFHNLYYVAFSFIDSSLVKKGDRFTYIATQHTQLPKRFGYWEKVYQNKTTGVTLYGNGGQEWIY